MALLASQQNTDDKKQVQNYVFALSLRCIVN